VAEIGEAPPGIDGSGGRPRTVRVVAPSAHPTLYQRRGKPVLDRTVGLVLLLLALPFLIVVSLFVRVSLGPGIVFRQERVGLGGRTFEIIKFRTLQHSRRREARQFVGPDRRRTHKHPEDPRLTRTGRILRRFSLDELPQLINVVKGDMSLVGPRPELVSIVDSYEPWQHRRHDVKPGLTGLWQVSAREQPMHEATDVDLEYVESVSFLNDMKILLLTLPAALGSKKGF
jgi:lipopolysaccharide/colanic/teichoic acid biosynthesis glycosyltransferase